jgi:tetratricopeptide (TPR) repeat protein
MGDSFWAVHHYCWALINANRAMQGTVSRSERDFMLTGAIADCIYVLENSAPDFPLRPEILLRMGQYYVMVGNLAEAMDKFEVARKIKSDYWPIYLEISKINVTLGRREVAAEVLRAGLSKVPDEPNLTNALAELGGASNSGTRARAVDSTP